MECTLAPPLPQAMPLRVDSGTQCAWRRSVNKASQSESVRLSEAASHQILHSNALSSFLLRALPLCVHFYSSICPPCIIF
jgi:hypothetical protein